MNQKFHISPEEAVQLWVQKTIVSFNFCPFAAPEVTKNAIRYVSLETEQYEPDNKTGLFQCALEVLLEECKWLDEHNETETTLLILPAGFDDFYDFLDLVELAEALLSEQGFEGIYQIATFHPDYQFEGCPADDPANYTNRAPYPVLHLLRESSLERVIARHPDPEGIPERNTELARREGAAPFQKILAEISAGRK